MADRARYAANSDWRTERRRERRAAESSEQRETRLARRRVADRARFAAILLCKYSYPVMPTEQCVFLILYIHSVVSMVYCILYMYITKYGCVFLKLGESKYVAMDLIPILLGSLPLAHNAQHSLVYLLGERERAHLVVQLGRAVYIYVFIRYGTCARYR